MRDDHGLRYMPGTFHTDMRVLGIWSSPAFARAPGNNDCAERFIRTLKRSLLWVRIFDALEELRLTLLAARDVYNAIRLA